MSKTTQRELVLAYLEENKDRYVPVYEAIGEKHINGIGWVLFSHRSPARLTELFQEGFVDREMVKGRTGAYYYTYRYKSKESEQVNMFDK